MRRERDRERDRQGERDGERKYKLQRGREWGINI